MHVYVYIYIYIYIVRRPSQRSGSGRPWQFTALRLGVAGRTINSTLPSIQFVDGRCTFGYVRTYVGVE